MKFKKIQSGTSGTKSETFPMYAAKRKKIQNNSNDGIIFALTVLAILSCTIIAPTIRGAEPSAFDGTFRPDSKGFPIGWTIHEWQGYKPFPQVQIISDQSGQQNVLSLTDVKGKDGGAIQTLTRFPARSGSVGRVTFLAKGKGTAWMTFYYWSAKNDWNSTATRNSFTLSDQWQPHEFFIPVINGHRYETFFVTLAIGGMSGMELQVTNLKLDFQSSEIYGNYRLPRSWTMFQPSDSNFTPQGEQWHELPAKLNGTDGKELSLNAGTLKPALPLKSVTRNVWIFSELKAPYECEMTLGAGSSCPFEFYLNGEKILQNSSPKKIVAVEPDDQLKTVLVKKGVNIFAIRMTDVGPDSIIKLAGPEDLRGTIKRLRIDRAVGTEDFNGTKLRCSGNPQRIQGNPTPGLLTKTGQGIFQTTEGKSLRFDLSKSTVTLDTQCDIPRYAAAGTRIQNFNRQQDASRSNATFEIRARAAGKNVVCRITSDEKSNNLTVDILAEGKKLDSFPISSSSLPADFLFGIAPNGHWAFSAASLVNSQTRYRYGSLGSIAFRGSVAFDFELTSLDSHPAEITLDNLVTGQASLDSRTGNYPFIIDLAAQFDPVKAEWPLVFSDEFNGNTVDTKNWFYSPSDHQQYAKVHDGLVEITADWNKQKTKIQSVSLYSNERFGYGYYEARVKFRMQSGWWSAFWLCTQGPSNPFTDGWEIDIYEDYYMGPKNPGEKPRGILDHNLHVFAGSTLRSWNYNSELPGSPDDFYVIGCKWTPFEVSYYLNGKLIKSQAGHSPYNSVTFDPFHHAAGFVPLYAILSGCCGVSGGDPKKGKFPESFFVDYVRIYRFPEENKPTIVWKSKPEAEKIHKPGSALHFEVEVKPSAQTGAAIKNVYLFDSGALLECKSVPPYTFDVDITNAYYSRTNYVKPGRSGVLPEFDRGTHAYCVFVQDEKGAVAHTEPVIEYLRRDGKSQPWLGKPQQIPGVIKLSHYDEGGMDIAYSDSLAGNDASQTFRVNESVDAGENVIGSVNPGEWIKYTVEVTKAGKYRAILKYGTPSRNQKGPRILIDGTPVGEWKTPPHKAVHWGTDTDTAIDNIELEKGKHEIVILMQGSYNLSTVTFEPQK